MCLCVRIYFCLAAFVFDIRVIILYSLTRYSLARTPEPYTHALCFRYALHKSLTVAACAAATLWFMFCKPHGAAAVVCLEQIHTERVCIYGQIDSQCSMLDHASARATVLTGRQPPQTARTPTLAKSPAARKRLQTRVRIN